MPANKFDQKALEALVAQNLRQSPPAISEEGPELPSDVMPLSAYPNSVEDQEPTKAKREHPSWWAHALNLGAAGYDAYSTDRIRKFNETEGGKSYIGIDADKQPYTIDQFDVNRIDLPMMGSDPSRGRIYGQTLGIAALQSLASHFLPKKIGNVNLAINGSASGVMGGLKHMLGNKLTKSVNDKKGQYEALVPYEKGSKPTRPSVTLSPQLPPTNRET